MTVKMIYCPYEDSTQEFPRASPLGTPSGKGVYLTVYSSSCHNRDTVQQSTELYTTCIGVQWPPSESSCLHPQPGNYPPRRQARECHVLQVIHPLDHFKCFIGLS